MFDNCAIFIIILFIIYLIKLDSIQHHMRDYVVKKYDERRSNLTPL